MNFVLRNVTIMRRDVETQLIALSIAINDKADGLTDQLRSRHIHEANGWIMI